MRSELHESELILRSLAHAANPRRLAGDAGNEAVLKSPLEARAVDAAMAEQSTMPAQRGSRREMTSASAGVDRSKRALDIPHAAPGAVSSAASDGALLSSLAEQLHLLQLQQDQIRRLLEQAESRSATSATVVDR